MDWADWAVAVKGLLYFVRTYDSIEFYYDVIQEGVGLLGTGAMSEW